MPAKGFRVTRVISFENYEPNYVNRLQKLDKRIFNIIDLNNSTTINTTNQNSSTTATTTTNQNSSTTTTTTTTTATTTKAVATLKLIQNLSSYRGRRQNIYG